MIKLLPKPINKEKLKKTPPKPIKLSTGNLLLAKIEIKVISPKIKVETVKGLLTKLKVPFLALVTRYEERMTVVIKNKNKNFEATNDWSKIGKTPTVVQSSKINNNGRTETFGRNFFIVLPLDQIWGVCVK